MTAGMRKLISGLVELLIPQRLHKPCHEEAVTARRNPHVVHESIGAPEVPPRRVIKAEQQ